MTIGNKSKKFEVVFNKEFKQSSSSSYIEFKSNTITNIKVYFKKLFGIYNKSELKVLDEPTQVFDGYEYTVILIKTKYYIFGIKVWTKNFK